jgi:hypothetical protein
VKRYLSKIKVQGKIKKRTFALNFSKVVVFLAKNVQKITIFVEKIGNFRHFLVKMENSPHARIKHWCGRPSLVYATDANPHPFDTQLGMP